MLVALLILSLAQAPIARKESPKVPPTKALPTILGKPLMPEAKFKHPKESHVVIYLAYFCTGTPDTGRLIFLARNIQITSKALKINHPGHSHYVALHCIAEIVMYKDTNNP